MLATSLLVGVVVTLLFVERTVIPPLGLGDLVLNQGSLGLLEEGGQGMRDPVGSLDA